MSKLTKGFALLPVLIAVVLGLVVIGGGAYYVVHQQSQSPTLSDNTLDDSQTSPTNTTNSNPVPTQTNTTSNTSPSVTIDQSSLVTTSPTPTITGTISGALNFSIQVGGSQGLSTERGGITISNGRWSAPFDSFAPGTYPVYVTDNNSGKLLASATLTIKANSNTTSGMSKYTDSQYPFTFSYPPTFAVCTNKTACVQYSADTQATFNVVVNPSETYEDCTAMTPGYYSEPATTQVTINGIAFEKDSSVDPAAGQRYGTESYRTYYNGACYRIDLHVFWSVANQSYPDTMYPKLEALLPSFSFTAPQTVAPKHAPPAPSPKTYNGPQLPVTFQYPGQLSVDSMSSTGRLYLTKQPGDERNGTITIGDWTKDYPTLAAIEAAHPDEAFSEQNTPITIGGESGVQVVKNSSDTRPSTDFYVQHNGKVYGIMVIDTYPSELQNFLSTFSFTN